jgi:hypothetical protein
LNGSFAFWHCYTPYIESMETWRCSSSGDWPAEVEGCKQYDPPLCRDGPRIYPSTGIIRLPRLWIKPELDSGCTFALHCTGLAPNTAPKASHTAVNSRAAALAKLSH